MQRLTIHLTNAPFVTRERKQLMGKDNIPYWKPKKQKCIVNTLSYTVKTKNEALAIVSSIGSTYGAPKVSKWYLSNIK